MSARKMPPENQALDQRRHGHLQRLDILRTQPEIEYRA